MPPTLVLVLLQHTVATQRCGISKQSSPPIWWSSNWAVMTTALPIKSQVKTTIKPTLIWWMIFTLSGPTPPLSLWYVLSYELRSITSWLAISIWLFTLVPMGNFHQEEQKIFLRHILPRRDEAGPGTLQGQWLRPLLPYWRSSGPQRHQSPEPSHRCGPCQNRQSYPTVGEVDIWMEHWTHKWSPVWNSLLERSTAVLILKDGLPSRGLNRLYICF